MDRSEVSEDLIYRPHARQELVLRCPCDEILYGGAAGAGKTFMLIFFWLQHEATYRGDSKGLILRKTNQELEDIIRECHKVFQTLPRPPKWNETKRTFTFSSGAVLEMGYLDSREDMYRYHGRQFTVILHDELTMWPDGEAYDFLKTRLRSAKGVRCQMIATTNPGGVGHTWVMKLFNIDKFPHGMVPDQTVTELPDGRTKTWVRIFIPGRLSDNPSLEADGAYRAQMMNRPEHIRKMLLDGRWDVIEGAFFKEWEPEIHIVKTFEPPADWHRWMGGDWGTAKPYSFHWLAESPSGDVYVYRELYAEANDPSNPNKGTFEPASLVAQKIRSIERQSGEYVMERYLDASCFSNDGHETTIAQAFSKEGVHFQKSMKRNKIGGINLLREYLKVVNRQSRLKIMENCRAAIRSFPSLQIDRNNPEQYDTRGEDHAVESIMYALRRNSNQSENGNEHSTEIRNARVVKKFGTYGAW